MNERRKRGRLVAEPADLDAFERLFKDHYHSLFRYAYAYLGSEDAAEDVIQDVFVNLWESQAPTRLSKSYLYRSIRNRSLDVLKSLKVRQSWAEEKRKTIREDELVSSSVDEQFIASELSLQVDRILVMLPEKQREVFMLSRYHGFTYKEIAETLNLSELHVKKQMSKVLRVFRAKLHLFLISFIGLSLLFFHFY